jgi:hypothetical protein
MQPNSPDRDPSRPSRPAVPRWETARQSSEGQRSSHQGGASHRQANILYAHTVKRSQRTERSGGSVPRDPICSGSSWILFGSPDAGFGRISCSTVPAGERWRGALVRDLTGHRMYPHCRMRNSIGYRQGPWRALNALRALRGRVTRPDAGWRGGDRPRRQDDTGSCRQRSRWRLKWPGRRTGWSCEASYQTRPDPRPTPSSSRDQNMPGTRTQLLRDRYERRRVRVDRDVRVTPG